MPDDWRKPDLDLSPQLDYAPPPPQRPWAEVAQDVLDLIGGWVGLAVLVGFYSIVLAPRAGMLAAIPILIGTGILQVAICFWLKMR